MDTDSLLAVGERGTHLLFDTSTIFEAFSQDARELESFVRGDGAAVEASIRGLLAQPSCGAGRAFVDALPREHRYVLVLLYFELLEGRVRKHGVVH